jgi:hypothetical protein
VTGTVAGVHASGRLTDPGSLSLVLNTITSGSSATSISVQPLEIKGDSHTKSNATKIGGGAALGAVLGGIFGGGKGAAIGAGAGGAAGTGAAAATGKKEAKVDAEALLTFIAATEPASTTIGAAAPEPRAADSNSAETKTAKSNERPDEDTAADSTSADKPASNASFQNAVLFTARDRRVIRNCISQHAAEFPQGTLEKEELPSGSERNVHVGGTLPRELQAKAQSLPLSCEQQLPKVPNDQERVVYTGRVLLLDGYGHILDMFDLSEND